MRAKLVVVGGEANRDSVELDLPAIIGRGADAGLRLSHPLVSREHCELYESEGKVYARDLQSLNGTYIGDSKITDQYLPPGELLTIGTVTFRAAYDILSGKNLDATDGGDPTQRQTQTVVELGPIEEIQAREGEAETDLRVDPAEADSQIMERKHVDGGTRLSRPED